MISAAPEQTILIILPAVSRVVMTRNGNWTIKNVVIKKDTLKPHAVPSKNRSTIALMTTPILKDVNVNRIWSPAPNLITASGKAAAGNMPPASWIIRGLVKKTDILRPEAAAPFRISTKNARTIPITSTNVSAAQTFTLAHLRCKALAPPAAENMPTANAQALINPANAEKLPAPHHVPGMAQQNTHHAKPVAMILAHQEHQKLIKVPMLEKQNAEIPVINAIAQVELLRIIPEPPPDQVNVALAIAVPTHVRKVLYLRGAAQANQKKKSQQPNAAHPAMNANITRTVQFAKKDVLGMKLVRTIIHATNALLADIIQIVMSEESNVPVMKFVLQQILAEFVHNALTIQIVVRPINLVNTVVPIQTHVVNVQNVKTVQLVQIQYVMNPVPILLLEEININGYFITDVLLIALQEIKAVMEVKQYMNVQTMEESAIATQQVLQGYVVNQILSFETEISPEIYISGDISK